MTNIIGVLGESTTANTAVGSFTAYTVPTGKASKVKLMYHAVMANTGTLVISVNGIPIAAPAAATGVDNVFSSTVNMVENTTTTAPTGILPEVTVGNAPQEYFLSAGDLVTFTVGIVDLASMNMQVVGSEIDVV